MGREGGGGGGKGRGVKRNRKIEGRREKVYINRNGLM